MSSLAIRQTATMARHRAVALRQPQRRTFLDWMTNYPDKINELKKLHQEGGRAIPTWAKQPNDKYTTAVGVGLMAIGMVQLTTGFYRLATGKGKME